jgi:mRNA interferase RelE/StbE
LKPRYKIVHTPRFERDFKKLSFESQRRIAEKILLLETDPFVGKALHGELKGLSSLRIGRCRVVYEIQDERITLHAVAHRRTVYRG